MQRMGTDTDSEAATAAQTHGRAAKSLDLGESVSTAATAAKLGDFFQYAIDQPVTLPRQKSALLPIVGKDVQATRVSIYNERTQAKFPLLGSALQEHLGPAPDAGPDHRVRGLQLRRRRPHPRSPAQRGTAALLRHRPWHRSQSRSVLRQRPRADRQGGQGRHPHDDQDPADQDVHDHQPQRCRNARC